MAFDALGGYHVLVDLRSHVMRFGIADPTSFPATSLTKRVSPHSSVCILAACRLRPLTMFESPSQSSASGVAGTTATRYTGVVLTFTSSNLRHSDARPYSRTDARFATMEELHGLRQSWPGLDQIDMYSRTRADGSSCRKETGKRERLALRGLECEQRWHV